MPAIRYARLAPLVLASTMMTACWTDSLFSGAGCVVGPCNTGGPTGPITLEAVVGVPPAMIDASLSPEGRYRARLTVGDSLHLYLVRYVFPETPCSKADTVRAADWGVTDVTVARVVPAAGGSVHVVATSPGATGVTSLAPPSSTNVGMSALPPREIVACGDPVGLTRYLAAIHVVP